MLDVEVSHARTLAGIPAHQESFNVSSLGCSALSEDALKTVVMVIAEALQGDNVSRSDA